MKQEQPKDLETPDTLENPLKLSSLDEIKGKAEENRVGRLIRLPSGLVFKIARPSISKMLVTGKFPSSLIQSAVLTSGGTSSLTPKQIEQSVEVMNMMVCEAVIEPKIVTTVEVPDGAISIEDVSDGDKQFIFNYVQTGVTALESFRSK